MDDGLLNLRRGLTLAERLKHHAASRNRGERTLVLGAEKSHFGGHPVAEADYQTCRREYLRVAAAMAPA